MADRPARQRVWNRIHRETPVPERPEADVVAFAECMQQRLPPGSCLLDVGCGRGRHVVYLSRSGFTVYGCDLSPVALETAAARAHQAGVAAGLQVSDLTRLPYADNLFAAALCVHVLPYQRKADIDKSVHELWRVVRPGGWLYFDLLACEDAEYGCGQKLEEHTFLDSDDVPVHFSSRQEVDELLNGFSWERMTRLELKSSSARIRVGWTVWAVKNGEERCPS